tara:strand:- start:3242 stop:4243 length:1002 start_codon:yes stop_codon:yes gene_type:complete
MTPFELQSGNKIQTPQKRRHVLDLDDFSEKEILNVLDSADSMRNILDRNIKKIPALRGKIVLTVFLEPSTRTRVSFEQAGKILSADVINISGSGSSVEKGESLLNTAKTLQSMQADLIVIRSPEAGTPYFLARNLQNMQIINAGDGAHAHPSQALLDLMTMRRNLGDLKGKKVVFVGDSLYSRVVRSDILGLKALGASVVLSGPPTMTPYPKIFDSSRELLSGVTLEPDLDIAIESADVIIALRIQKERQHSGVLPSMREYTRRWMVTEKRYQMANPGALLMHPGPLNEGIEIASSLAHSDESLIEEQVTNGVAIRMALLNILLMGNTGEIEE